MRASRLSVAFVSLALALASTGAVRAEGTCQASDVAAAQLKSPLIKSNDDAIALAKDYFALATGQHDLFEKRRYDFDVARAGEVWTATVVWMRRPRYPWDDWKRRGKVGKVTLCGYDGHLIGVETTY